MSVFILLTGSYKVAPPVPAKPAKYIQSATSRGGAQALSNQRAGPPPPSQFDSRGHAYYRSDSLPSAPGLPNVGSAYPAGGAPSLQSGPSPPGVGAESMLLRL